MAETKTGTVYHVATYAGTDRVVLTEKAVGCDGLGICAIHSDAGWRHTKEEAIQAAEWHCRQSIHQLRAQIALEEQRLSSLGRLR